MRQDFIRIYQVCILCLLLVLVSHGSFAAPASYETIFISDDCTINNKAFDVILVEVRNKNPEAISTLKDCLQLNRKLIFQASLIDPSQFQHAADILRQDENYIFRLLRVRPEILQYVAPDLLLDKDFMKRATYIQRDSLQYAHPSLRDDRIFMAKMIDMDYKNYIYASMRLKKVKEFATMALRDNGLYLEFAAPEIKDDKELVKIALKSNVKALKFASDRLQKDEELQKLADRKSSIASLDHLEKFLQETYLDESNIENIGLVISHRMKNFEDHKIIDRKFITKWQKFYRNKNNKAVREVRLIAVDSRNYAAFWKNDFVNYPGVIDKIEEFFLSHQIDQNTVDDLYTTFLYKVKDDPLTLVFNVYLLRDSGDAELGPDFANVNSLTAIVQKDEENNRWKMTVVDVIFDSEIKMDLAYKDGHKKYDLWDLYVVDEADKNPKIIFKTDERFREFLEVFEEQSGGKYEMIYRTDLKDARQHLD